MPVKAVKGKNGFLFLSNDSNQVIDQITGKQKLSKVKLDFQRQEVKDRAEFCSRCGADYYFFIVPNKHCIYDEYLPDGIVLSPERPAVQLHDLSDRVFYPVDILRAQKKESLVYHKTDTHWNSVGAACAWNCFSEKARLGITIDISRVSSLDIVGDLGNKFTPNISSESFKVDRDFTSRKIWFNHLHNRGCIKIYENSKSDLKRAVIFGDSFTNEALQYIAEYFSELYFFFTPSFSKKTIEELRPDIVINSNVERYVHTLKRSVESIFEYEFIEYIEQDKYNANAIRAFLRVDENENIPKEYFSIGKDIANDFVVLQDSGVYRSMNEIYWNRDSRYCHDVLDKMLEECEMSHLHNIKHKVYFADRDFVNAKKHIERAVALSPWKSGYHYAYGLTLYMTDELDRGIAEVRHAIDSETHNHMYYYQLGCFLLRKGDFEGAWEAQQKAIELEPEYPEPYLQLSHLFMRMEQIDEAIQWVNKAIALKKDGAKYYHQLARLRMHKNDLAGAEKAQRKAVGLAPEHEHFTETLTKILDTVRPTAANLPV